jgi:PIN domain nuclease of toxin-antitoxin system
MRILLDTHAFLWFVAGDDRLSRKARRAMEGDDAELFLSAAVAWEMAIKSSLGRLTLPSPVEQYVAEKLESGFHMLPIEWTHAAAVETMPFHHRDPFDRLLAAQAIIEKMPIVTADPVFRLYKADVVW